MRRYVITLGLVVAMGAIPIPATAHWVGDHCFTDNHLDSNVRRLDAQAYAAVADDEGYEWGGGCWNNNDVDDTPNAPDSGGEGPDCSGFVFKTWELRAVKGADGFRWYNKLEDRHGPYTSHDFHSPLSDWPFHRLPNKDRLTTLYMDAFAKRGHIGMLYTSSYPSPNTDYIIEAAGDASGTDINVRSYRFDSAYVAVRREGWTADCWPRCAAAARNRVVIP